MTFIEFIKTNIQMSGIVELWINGRTKMMDSDLWRVLKEKVFITQIMKTFPDLFEDVSENGLPYDLIYNPTKETISIKTLECGRLFQRPDKRVEHKWTESSSLIIKNTRGNKNIGKFDWLLAIGGDNRKEPVGMGVADYSVVVSEKCINERDGQIIAKIPNHLWSYLTYIKFSNRVQDCSQQEYLLTNFAKWIVDDMNNNAPKNKIDISLEPVGIPDSESSQISRIEIAQTKTWKEISKFYDNHLIYTKPSIDDFIDNPLPIFNTFKQNISNSNIGVDKIEKLELQFTNEIAKIKQISKNKSDFVSSHVVL